MGLQRVIHDWATEKQQQQRLFPDKIQRHLPWGQVWNYRGQPQQQQSVYTKGNCKHMQLPENTKVVWYLSKVLIFHSHIFRSFRIPWETEMSEILSLKNTLWSLKMKAPNFSWGQERTLSKILKSKLWNQSFKEQKIRWNMCERKVPWKCKLYFGINLLVSLTYLLKKITFTRRRFSCKVWCIGGLNVTESEKVKSMI